MKATLLVLTLCTAQLSWGLSFPAQYDEDIEDCEELLEEIAQSKCGKTALGFLKGAYIKIGLNLSRRSMKFEKNSNKETEFEMIGEFTPSPLLSFSLGDSYFEHSNFGYQLGGSYFSDTAFKQKISRGDNDKSVDLFTYSKMTVYAFSPTLFYTFSREDDTPNNAFTAGLGLNVGYSKVKGTAYVTDDKTNSACYATGSNFLKGSATKSDIKQNCQLDDYDSNGLSYGVRLYLAYEFEKWITELSSSVYIQGMEHSYKFSTYDISLGVSRKFGL